METRYHLFISENADPSMVTHVIFLGYTMPKEDVIDTLYNYKIIVLGLNFENPNAVNYVDASGKNKIEMYHTIYEGH